jgi:hypothetical protein
MAGEADLASGSDEIRESVGHLRAATRPTNPSSIATHQAQMAAIGAFIDFDHPWAHGGVPADLGAG